MANAKFNSLVCLWFARYLPSFLAVDSVTVLQFFQYYVTNVHIKHLNFFLTFTISGPSSWLQLWKETEYSLFVVPYLSSMVRKLLWKI